MHCLAGGNLDISAGSLTDNSGTLQSGGNLLVSTTGNLTNTAGTLTSGGNLLLNAGSNLTLTASTVNATGTLGLLAGGDINFDTTQSNSSSDSGGSVSNTVTNNLTTLTSGGSTAIYAGGNLTSNGAQLTSGGALSLGAGGDLTLQSVTNDTQTTTNTSGNHWTDTLNTNQQAVVGTALNAVGDINLNAGDTLTVSASSATSQNGAVDLSGVTVDLATADQQSTSNESYVSKTSGFLGLSHRLCDARAQQHA